MYIKFSRIGSGDQSKPQTNLFAKNGKLHEFATCNSNFEKSRLSNIHYPTADIQAEFEINRRIGILIFRE